MHEQCKQMCDAQFLTYSTKSKHVLTHYDSIPADHLNQTNVPVTKVVELKDAKGKDLVSCSSSAS